jgi:hypothetical protein
MNRLIILIKRRKEAHKKKKYTGKQIGSTLERAWLMTVLPQPKAPGIAQVPPSTDGNNASRTRCKR